MMRQKVSTSNTSGFIFKHLTFLVSKNEKLLKYIVCSQQITTIVVKISLTTVRKFTKFWKVYLLWSVLTNSMLLDVILQVCNSSFWYRWVNLIVEILFCELNAKWKNHLVFLEFSEPIIINYYGVVDRQILYRFQWFSDEKHKKKF